MSDKNLDILFKKAFEQASKIEGHIAPDTMLKLYAYYKQAVKGDLFKANDSIDLHAAFKINAWIQLRGMSTKQAKQEYINLVNSLIN